MPTLSDISTSPATIDEDASRSLWWELRNTQSGRYNNWYYNSNAHYGVSDLAELFINNHAAVDSSYDRMYSHTPVAVFRFRLADGLLYSNGAVAIVNAIIADGKYQYIELWIEKETAALFGYPEPESIKIDGNSSV